MSAVATANLGRAAARAGGRADEARELLGSALSTLREIQAASFVYETEVRLAEAAVLAGDHDAALKVADAAADLGEGALTPSVQALLHRVRAYGHFQAGRVTEAERELDRSLAVARACDALYEVALSLQASARVRRDASLATEARALLDSLHVVVAPEPPLP